jgi:hypothetical protein
MLYLDRVGNGLTDDLHQLLALVGAAEIVLHRFACLARAHGHGVVDLSRTNRVVEAIEELQQLALERRIERFRR